MWCNSQELNDENNLINKRETINFLLINRIAYCICMYEKHTHTHAHARTHVRTHAHTHARTHARTPLYSPRNMNQCPARTLWHLFLTSGVIVGPNFESRNLILLTQDWITCDSWKDKANYCIRCTKKFWAFFCKIQPSEPFPSYVIVRKWLAA